MEIKGIKELIKTLEETNIQEFKLQKENFKLEIIRSSKSEVINNTLKNEEIKNDKVKEINSHESKTTNIKHDDSENIYFVKSPIVGVYYSSSSPGSESFVNCGDYVEKGQALCIIEAMKIMNEIESEVSGEIIEILVNNEELVEYGQPIMKIRRK